MLKPIQNWRIYLERFQHPAHAHGGDPMSENLPGKSQFLVYETEDGQVKIDVRLFVTRRLWLTQQLMADLFQTSQQNISLHVQNVYQEGELAQEATYKKDLSVRREGKREVKRLLDYYSLDMIISVGYRVKSRVATRFRIWATQHLREYIIKGFVLDDERLKNPDQPFDYFDELIRRIQDIRTSERRFTRKLPISTPPVSTMTPPSRSASNFQNRPEQNALGHYRKDRSGNHP